MPSRKITGPDDGRLAVNRRKNGTSKAVDVPKSRMRQLLDGDITVEDLDDEEIRLGRCKDKNGKMTGRPPKSFPRELHDALRVEFRRRMEERFQSSADIGLKTLLEVAQNRHAAAPARVQAALALLERGVGKVPDKVEQTVEIKKFEEVLEGILVDVGGDPGSVIPINRKKAV